MCVYVCVANESHGVQTWNVVLTKIGGRIGNKANEPIKVWFGLGERGIYNYFFNHFTHNRCITLQYQVFLHILINFSAKHGFG